MKLRVLIVDDELDARKTIQRFIERTISNVEIIGEANCVANAIKAIEDLQPDLVFLDIQMSDGTGFDVIDQLNKFQTPEIIFTTAYDEYAIKAFRVKAADYLLKPIDPMELMDAVSAVRKKLTAKNELARLNTVINEDAMQKIAFSTRDGQRLHHLNELIRIEADGNYSSIYLIDGSKIMLAKTLKEFEKMVPMDRFIRIHQSHLINVDFVRSIDKTNNTMVLNEQTILPISRRKKKEIVERINAELSKR